MSVAETVADLNAIDDLAEGEADPKRRDVLRSLADRLARNTEGAKVSEAAELLGVTPPTVRTWIEAGVLRAVPESTPRRVDIVDLARTVRRVNQLRTDGHTRNLLSALQNRSLDLDNVAIAAICQRRGVRRLWLFGSALSTAFDPDTSDIDFLVEFSDAADDPFDSYFGLKEDLEQLLGRPVDLVTPKSSRTPTLLRRSSSHVGSCMRPESPTYLWDAHRAASLIAGTTTQPTPILD